MRILQDAVMAALMMGAATGLAHAQIGSGAPIQIPSAGRGGVGFPSPDGRGEPGDPMPRMEEQQAKSRNSERQKRLMADTDRLLALVEDLKRQLENSDGKAVDVTKKAEEIERLARSVKERMRG